MKAPKSPEKPTRSLKICKDKPKVTVLKKPLKPEVNQESLSESDVSENSLVEISTNEKTPSSSYPDLIRTMLNLCMKDTEEIKFTLAGRRRTYYKNVFTNYKEKMSAKDRSIVSSGLVYIYDFSRVNSIPKNNAEWLIGIHEIPISHIVSYTNKDILKQLAKQYSIPCSNKKAEEIVTALRDVMEKN